ncbi:glycosyltransferase family 39 protein [bacterium]|nr:glycosyltransferase family 39 protein [bacterium]
MEERNIKAAESCSIWFWIILAAGFAVRLCYALCASVDLDEGFTYFFAQPSLSDILKISHLHDPYHPPTYYMFIHIMQLISLNEVWLRLPSLICGTAAVWVSYLIGRTLKGEGLGLFLAFIRAFLLITLLNDCQIRSYGPMNLGVLLCMLGFINILKYKTPFKIGRISDNLNWLIFYLTVCLTAWIGYLGCAFIGGASLLFILAPKDTANKRKIVYVCLLAVLSVFLWLGYTYLGVPAGNPKNYFFSVGKVCDLFFIPTHFFVFNTNFSAGGREYDASFLRSALDFAGNLFFWSLLVWGAKSFFKEQKEEAKFIIFAPFLPIAVFYLFSIFNIVTFQLRYIYVFFIPAAFLIFAAILGSISQNWLKKLFCTVIGAVLVYNFAVVLFLPKLSYYWNQDWRGIITFIYENKKDSDVIFLFVPYTKYAFACNYAPGKTGFAVNEDNSAFIYPKENYDKLDFTDITSPMLTEKFFGLLKGRRVFLILNQAEMKRKEAGEIMAALDARYKTENEFVQVGNEYWSCMRIMLLTPKD